MTSTDPPEIAFIAGTSSQQSKNLTRPEQIQTDRQQEEDETESDSDIDIESHPNLERLCGGTTLPDEDEDASTRQSAQATVIAPESKLKLVLQFIKISLLFVVWILSVICLICSKEHSHEENIMTVEPQRENTYWLDDLLYDQAIGVTLKGPFILAEDLKTFRSLGGTYLEMRIERILYDATGRITEKVPVSDTLKIELSHTSQNVVKKHVFQLHTHRDDYNQRSELEFVLTTNDPKTITINVVVDEMPVDKHQGIIYGAIILVGLYIMIIWEIINRTFAAMIASIMALAVLGVLNARPSLTTIMNWIDVETLMLLFGMMILVAVLSESGVFDYLAVYAFKITRGSIWPLINCLCVFAAVLSTFLDNVTMMMLMTPVSIRLCEVLDLSPMPVLLCMVIFSNVGAAITPVGDPPNVIITTNPFMKENGITFGGFILHMTPGVLLAMVSTYVQLRFRYRKIKDLSITDTPEIEELRHEILVWERLAAGITALSKDEDDVRGILMRKITNLKAKLNEMTASHASTKSTFEENLEYLEAEYPLKNKQLLYKSAVAFVFVIGLFFLHSVPNFIHLTLGWIALLGALMLLILSDIKDMEAVLSRVEWSTLLFFASLFVLMECLTELGLMEVIGNFAVKLILAVSPDNRLMLALIIILWITSISAGFLDNIPVATVMLKIVISLANNKELQLPLHPLVWALAFGSCFGGNGTLIGASANVVCAGVAEQHGYKIKFLDFFAVGFPIVLGSTTVATVYLLIAHCVFTWH